MSFDPHLNLRRSTVAGAPSPATSGTALTLATGEGALFPATSLGAYNLLVWPTAVDPTRTNSEIIRVNTRAGDVLSSITRAQEGSTARSIIVGDQVALVPTAKTFEDIEAQVDPDLVHNGVASYPFTRAGIQAAHDDLPFDFGHSRLPAGEFTSDGTTITITKNNVRISGQGDATKLEFDPSANASIFYFQGTAAASTKINVAGVEGANTIQLDSSTPAAVAGAWISIVQPDPGGGGAIVHAQVAQIASTTGGSTPTLTLHQSLRAAYVYDAGTPANTTTVAVLTPNFGAQVEDMKFVGNGNDAALSNCIYMQYAVKGSFNNLTAEDCPCALVYLDTCFDMRENGFSIEGGGDDQTATLQGIRSSEVYMSNISIWDGPAEAASGGFGVSFSHCSDVHAVNVHSSNTNGRGLKWYLTNYSTFIACSGDWALNSLTGLMVTGNHNEIIGCGATGNGFVGLHVAGDYNNIIGGQYVSNGTDIFIASGTDNALVEPKYATINDSGTATIGLWKDWTPVLTQGGSAIPITVNHARYIRHRDKTIDFTYFLTLTAGTNAVANNAIKVTTPVNANASLISVVAPFTGQGRVYDGTNNYFGNIIPNGTGQMSFQELVNGSPPRSLGATSASFASALATGNIISAAGSYEAA